MKSKSETPQPITFSMVGAGWRSEFFLRVVHARPDLFSISAVYARDPEKAEAFAAKWGVPVHTDFDEILESPGDFTVTSIPRSVNPEYIMRLVDAGIPVLTETPPAGDVDAMTKLCRKVAEAKGKVQVAEQYHLQPHQATRLRVARSGRLGTISQAQVSVAHGYHGVSLIRRYLNAGYRSPTIRATTFESPMVAGPGRSGPPTEQRINRYSQTIAWLDFGDSLGVFDFVGSQYFGWIRSERVLVRGDRGEIANDAVSFLADYRTPIKADLRRVATGAGSDLEGYHLKGYTLGEQWIYENPLGTARLSDDEIAVGSCLLAMKRYLTTGEEFYSLAEGCQDTYLAHLIDRAASTGETVTAEPQMWSG